MPAPLLILVSGPPGAGKTTLATQLAERLTLPLLSIDTLKASIARSLDPTEHGRGGAAGQGAFALASTLARQCLDAGASLILEKAWQRGRSEADLLPLLAKARGVQIHVTAAREVAIARGLARPARAGLVDMAVVQKELEDGTLDWESFGPLELVVPLVIVRTDDGPIDVDALVHDHLEALYEQTA
jgi:predicted kinase